MSDVVELAATVGLDAVAAVVHETAVEKGFWSRGINDDIIGNKLALVHSEVTEVLEAVRKEQGEHKVVEEMVDIFIRTLDLYAAMKDAGLIDSSLDDVLQSKMKINAARPYLHGNRF